MEGSTTTIRSLPNGTSSFPKLGPLEGAGTSAAGRRARSQGSRRTGSERGLCRRKLGSRQKGGLGVGKTKRGKGTKIMAVADGHGLPLAICTESASPAEVKLVSQTLEQRFVAEVPERLVGDKAYDSDALD